MANRRFEMYEVRQVIARLRLGGTDRETAPSLPQATIMLDFPIAETAQVDFGQGPPITDRHSGEIVKTWIFVMTLAWSRHQYAEIVPNQKVETWLSGHRHAFEWFNGIPKKVSYDFVAGNKIV